jgi:hypothetical protein
VRVHAWIRRLGGDVPGTDQVSVTPMPAAKEICPPMLLIWTIAPERRARMCGSTARRVEALDDLVAAHHHPRPPPPP